LLEWCGARGFDLTLIETMPMGDIGDGVAGRDKQYLPLSIVRARLRRRWTLTESDHVTGGPARYFDVAETGRQIGFITPMSHNFCESCNRVRLACDGTLYMCLGQEDAADLRSVVRLHPDDATLDDAIRDAIARKPKGHDFVVDRGKKSISVGRTMSATGG
jgi:cyclic pyranopterin phosphate synthase